MVTSLCPVNRLKASSTRSSKHWSTCISTEFSTVISSHKTCWSIRAVRTSSWLTLVWRVLSAYPLRLIHMRWSLFGIGALKFSLARKHILSELIFGQQGASSRKWCSAGPFSWEIPKLTKSSKYSRSLVLQTRTTGRMPSNSATSNQPSPSSVACLWLNIHRPSTSSRSTCWPVWLRWTPTDAYLHWPPSNTPTSMTWTGRALISANNSSEQFFASFFH